MAVALDVVNDLGRLTFQPRQHHTAQGIAERPVIQLEILEPCERGTVPEDSGHELLLFCTCG